MKVQSQGFGKLSGIGKINPLNRLNPETCESRRIEVSVSQDRMNTAIDVDIVVPIQRSELGSRRVANLRLNGAQARTLYDTLNRFFEDHNQNK